MTPEEIREYDDKLIDKIVRRAAIFSRGVQTEFWDELKVMLQEEREKAFNDFLETPYTEKAAIIEQQVIGKLGKYLEAKVRGAIEEAESLTQ